MDAHGAGSQVNVRPAVRLTIARSDIGPELCRRCGACCRIFLTLRGTDSRYRVFLRTLGFDVHPAPAMHADDCCEKVHDARIDTGDCRHLETGSDASGRLYTCRLHGTRRYPRLCADYDCVAWAKHDDTYDAGNRTLVAAQRALDRLRGEAPDAD